MELPEHIRKRLTKRGGRYTTDHILMNARINLDNHMALKQICAENRFLIGNVLDYLIEGFIDNYRQMWPVEGVYQTQLNDNFDSSEPELPPSPVLKVSTQTAHVLKNPDYYSKAWPDIVLLRSLAKDYKWDTEAEQRLRDIAANTKEESTRTNIEMQLQQWKERLEKKPQDLIRK